MLSVHSALNTIVYSKQINTSLVARRRVMLVIIYAFVLCAILCVRFRDLYVSKDSLTTQLSVLCTFT